MDKPTMPGDGFYHKNADLGMVYDGESCESHMKYDVLTTGHMSISENCFYVVLHLVSLQPILGVWEDVFFSINDAAKVTTDWS